MTTTRILTGDVREQLGTLPAESVHCVVTSPPYFGLRDYGVDGQIGLERTPDEFVAVMVDVFREVRRVLRRDGVCWVNLGDSYAGNPPGNARPDHSGTNLLGTRGEQGSSRAKLVRAARKFGDLKPKDLVGMPWRVAFALQADGWWLRSDCIWHKPNPMPESVTDRPTKAHEYVFLLTRSERYAYDAEAVSDLMTGTPHAPGNRASSDAGHLRNDIGSDAMLRVWGSSGFRNARTVWTIPTQSFDGAHFATFPDALAERCIKAGASEHGACAKCGAPWERITQKGAPDIEHQRACGGDANGEYHGEATKDYANGRAQDASATKARILAGMCERVTTGWRPTCDCSAAVVPCTVLDPFAGAGTTLLVARRLGRAAIGIELNPEYAAMAQRRLDKDDLERPEVLADGKTKQRKLWETRA